MTHKNAVTTHSYSYYKGKAETRSGLHFINHLNIFNMFLIVKRCSTLIFILLSFIAKAQDSLTINGSLDKIMDGRIICLAPVYPYRSDLPNPKIYVESKVSAGKFSFSIPANTLERYSISIKNDSDKNRYRTFLLLPRKTEIIFLDTLLKTYQVKGNDIDKEYEGSLIPITDRSKYTQPEMNKLVTSWIENHSNSPLNTYILNTSLLNKISDEEILRLYNLIPDAVKTNSYGKELKFISENLFIGKNAPDFSQSDTTGVKISLSQFRGKYVLIDFWASWCIPCRAENPFLVAAIKKYGNKNLEIISVSLDDKRDPWIEAIKKDGINGWKHISDLKGWENQISKNYRIRSVPRNFLISPDGKIIGKNLRGKTFMEELSKLIH
jgi:thiol-disulfide isomerase/thioredoxin